MQVRPFCGVRPPRDLVDRVSSKPYDVLSSDEARKEASRNPYSLYHIIKPEINFKDNPSEYDPRVYDSGREYFRSFQRQGWLVQDQAPQYYVYSQTMDGRTQYGIVVAAAVADYMEGRIKKHELTRKDKEENRMKHVRATMANMEPVFFAYRHNEGLHEVVRKVISTTPEYDFEVDGVRHTFWCVPDQTTIDHITALFKDIPCMYIADGHHRSAAAALVGDALRKEAGENYRGDEEFNYFLAVCFDADELHIMDYNRVVKDLNGMSVDAFLQAVRKYFDIVPQEGIYKPSAIHTFGLYVGGKWYSLTAHKDTYDPNDPIGVLDVTISSNYLLDKVLDLRDLRTNDRIDFVGGIRGLEELQQRVDSGEMQMALALYPVSMDQLMTIADTGNIMPPKTTWFEPKLRSGLIVHLLN